MKKLFLVIISALLAFTLSACKQENTDVPLILYNEDDPYITGFKEHILFHAKDHVNIVSYDSQNSQLLQNEIIEELLLQHPQILIVNPVDRLGAYTIIDQAKALDIPIIFINREPLYTDMFRYEKTYYIGAPAENSAVLQAEMIIDLFGNPDDLSSLDKNDDNIIQMVLFKGEQGHQDAEIRSEVVIQELEDFGYTLEIVSIEISDWQKDIAHSKMTQLIRDLDPSTSIELVISNNDYMAIGAIDAMIEQNLFIDVDENGVYEQGVDEWIPVIGIDGIDEALPYIDAGYLYGTVKNDSETMSIMLIELVEALLNHQDLSTLSFELEDGKYIWVDYQKYEKEN